MNGIVYYIFHIESGKGYVGKHHKNDLLARFNRHFKNRSYIGNALRKYGKESFKVVLLDTGNSDEELHDKEVFWIDKLNTLGSDGYNLTEGGEGLTGWKQSEETKRAISVVTRDKTWNDAISRGGKGQAFRP